MLLQDKPLDLILNPSADQAVGDDADKVGVDLEGLRGRQQRRRCGPRLITAPAICSFSPGGGASRSRQRGRNEWPDAATTAPLPASQPGSTCPADTPVRTDRPHATQSPWARAVADRAVTAPLEIERPPALADLRGGVGARRACVAAAAGRGAPGCRRAGIGPGTQPSKRATRRDRRVGNPKVTHAGLRIRGTAGRWSNGDQTNSMSCRIESRA